MYKCDTCNTNFTLKKNLIRHMKNLHNLTMRTDSKWSDNSKEVQNKCSVCQLAFVQGSSLRRHQRIKHKINIRAKIKRIKSNYITFEPSNLEDYPLLEKLVPEDYIYKVNCIEDLKDEGIRAKFEIADCSENMFLCWLSKLEQKSEVTYRVKSFTKSNSPKIVFNKVYRCIHNTYPNKFCIPHPKHTGCPATLTVRIKKCSEALSVKNTISYNSVIMIPLKAIVTLYHCHNHIFSKSMKEYSTEKENKRTHSETECYEHFKNHHNIENNLNNIHFGELNYSHSSSSTETSEINDKYKKNTSEKVEEVILYESENKKFVTNDNIQKLTFGDDKFDLSDEIDNYILVENVNTENSLHNNDNENELYQLLLDYDSVNERMIQQFRSNPKYFMPAIKTYILAMKNKFSSKESLSTALNSFGKN